MDNLTHTLTGLMLARSGVAGKLPRAGLIMMVAANVPDVDVVTWLGGTLTYLEYHRWFTHAVLAAPLMAALVAGFARLLVRGPFPWVRAFIAALIGVASHLLLDWTNVYGIRLLLPVSPEWLRLDTVSIVDAWLWVIFAAAVIAPALGRLVSSEIGAPSSSGRGWAIFALVLICGFQVARYLAHDRAVALMNARIYSGAAPVRVAAFPSMWNPLQWRGLVETSDAYRIYRVNLLHDFDPSDGSVLYKGEPNSATIAASKTQTFQRFLSFSAFPLWRTMPVAELEGATEVAIYDMRFGDPQQPGFTVTAVVNRSNQVQSTAFSFGGLRR